MNKFARMITGLKLSKNTGISMRFYQRRIHEAEEVYKIYKERLTKGEESFWWPNDFVLLLCYVFHASLSHFTTLHTFS